ncbi:thioredoxin-dependent thiol peroxidase [Candidatus Peregrinibacteria bacterium]|nr:MAG: thioredoxin-dependent thiol peroxidase [Candidatus Peregrinibacteria bacterium]
MAKTLDLGDKVPDFKLPSSEGKEMSLHDFAGKKIVLYFYPKDDTPGCTVEACDFRDTQADFSKLNAVIVGVSKDSLNSHEKFIGKYKLPFVLLSDEDLKLMEAFGVWKEKTMYGKTALGVMRSTFLIDENGVLVKAWRNVKAAGHVQKVLQELPKV